MSEPATKCPSCGLHEARYDHREGCWRCPCGWRDRPPRAVPGLWLRSSHVVRTLSLGTLLLVCSGCAAIPAALVLDATVGAIGIVQKWKARAVEREHIEEIKRLREEIRKLREE